MCPTTVRNVAILKAHALSQGPSRSPAGGRQVDGAVSSLAALEDIMGSPVIRGAQCEGKLTVLFDSGIRTGSDVIKALALGAQAVLRA